MRSSISKKIVAGLAALAMTAAFSLTTTPADAQFRHGGFGGGFGGWHGGGFGGWHGGGFGGGRGAGRGGGWRGGGWGGGWRGGGWGWGRAGGGGGRGRRLAWLRVGRLRVWRLLAGIGGRRAHWHGRHLSLLGRLLRLWISVLRRRLRVRLRSRLPGLSADL